MTCWNVSTQLFVVNRGHKPRPATLVAVAIGGTLGAVARVLLPWPTTLDAGLQVIDPLPIVVVNVVGAALLGLVTGYTKVRHWSEPLTKGATTGFFGSFTSMSALAVAYLGLTLGQAAFFAGSMVQGLLIALIIIALVTAYLFLTTVITIATLRLGTRLAGGTT